MISGKEAYLIPELCTFDGIPEKMRKDAYAMRNIMSKCSRNPKQKFDTIAKFSSDIFSQEVFTQWSIDINVEPIKLTSKILEIPKIVTNEGRVVDADEKSLRRLNIQDKKDLTFENWWIVYEGKNQSKAEQVASTLIKSCHLVGTSVN